MVVMASFLGARDLKDSITTGLSVQGKRDRPGPWVHVSVFPPGFFSGGALYPLGPTFSQNKWFSVKIGGAG